MSNLIFKVLNHPFQFLDEWWLRLLLIDCFGSETRQKVEAATFWCLLLLICLLLCLRSETEQFHQVSHRVKQILLVILASRLHNFDVFLQNLQVVLARRVRQKFLELSEQLMPQLLNSVCRFRMMC